MIRPERSHRRRTDRDGRIVWMVLHRIGFCQVPGTTRHLFLRRWRQLRVHLLLDHIVVLAAIQRMRWPSRSGSWCGRLNNLPTGFVHHIH